MSEAVSDLGNLSGSCPCSIDYDGPDVYSRTIRKARKEHRCCECGDWIRVGERYEYITALYPDCSGWDEFKTCLPCANLAMSMGCRQHMGLVEMFYDMFGWDYRDDPATWEDEDDE